MSKYKGNYGNSKATSAPPVAAASSAVESSTLLSLVELLDSYGFDLPAMLLLFWCLVLFIVVCGVNLYLTLVKRQQGVQGAKGNRNQREDVTSEPTITANSAASLHSAPKKYHSQSDDDNQQWIQKVIEWLYRANVSQPEIITECIDAWLASLNSKSSKLTVENGIHVEFVRLYRDKSAAIRFSDVQVESQVNDNVVRVAATSRDLSNGQSALYEIELNKFSALLKVVCKPEDSLFIVRFLERPETKVHINGPLSPSEKSFSPDLIINGILNILTSTLVDLNFFYAANFPKYESHSLSSFDGTHEIPNGSGTRSRRSIERKLFVTIVKANNLALNQSKEGHEVYCTIEINEPREKRKTSSIRKDANSPVWQDHFLFGLNEKSREILFEVFDSFQEKKTSPRTEDSDQDECLGFGIANILELRLNPSEKLSIPLQTRTSRNGVQGGSLEIELLLMEHKLPASMCTDEADEQLIASEKIQYPKLANELTSSYYRDLSSIISHSLRRRSSQSLSVSSSGFNENSLLGAEDLDQDICANPIPNYDGNESDDLFSANRSSKASSFLASLEGEHALIGLPLMAAKPSGHFDLESETLMSSRATYDSLSTSNSSLTSSSGASPKESKPRRFARLAKIASLGSLFSNLSSSSAGSGPQRGLLKAASNSSLSASNGNLAETRHRHPSLLYATGPQQHRHQHTIPSLAMSLPVISPLLDVKRRSYPTQPDMVICEEVDPDVPGILVTRPSFKTNKPSSLRWLRGTSLRGKSAKKPIELPSTVLYPNNVPSFEPNRCQMNGTCNGNSLATQLSMRPSLTQSNLDIVNKRSSVYSQLSFDSIDSRLSLVDSTLDEDYLSANRLVESATRQRPPPLPAPIVLQTTSHTAPLYSRYSEKAKSDTHLYFTLDEASTEEALRENSAYLEDRERQYFFGDGDLPEDGKDDNSSTTPPATPLKRNTNRRTSLYAKFISAKRQTTKASSVTNSTVNSVKQRFKFRSSSKVPRLASQSKPVSENQRANGPLTNESSQQQQQPVSLSKSCHRTSEPSLHREPFPAPPRVGKMSIVSMSSVNLSASPGELDTGPLRLQPPPRRRSYKNADMSFMQRAQSSPLHPLTTNSANSTSSHLDHYTRSSLNTIKSDDNAHSSEGYGTDRGISPEAPHTSDALPPTRPESRVSQPRERSLIRTIRKRLSFSKRSKSVERQPNSSHEPSVGSANDRDERARSVPGSREPSAPREMANGKKQESFLSLASNTSFFAENSTLVLECTVNGEKKHYIVPYSKANKRKYRRRKGVKLHVFNDHLFVAQHVSSSQECQVCSKTFPLRIGKQGYACRECGFLTHKQCHINVDSFCPANGAARLNFEVDSSDTPKQIPSPVPEVRVIAPTEPFMMNEKEIL